MYNKTQMKYPTTIILCITEKSLKDKTTRVSLMIKCTPSITTSASLHGTRIHSKNTIL